MGVREEMSIKREVNYVFHFFSSNIAGAVAQSDIADAMYAEDLVSKQVVTVPLQNAWQ